jgi:elongation factor G
MSYTTDQIRNIAVAGHGSTGKTTLVENLLFTGGQIDRPEQVASGKTVSDFTEEEIEHKISIHTSLSHIFWKGHKINMLDTPGASDFVGEVISAFRTAESAVLLVDGEAGVQIETIKLWRALDQRDKPRIVFINKMDKERADFQAVLSDLNDKFKVKFVPVTIPMGQKGKYEGVIDLIHMKAYTAGGAGKKETEIDIPAAYKDLAQKAHEEMIDAAAEGDDELAEKYLDGQELTIDEAIRGLTEDLADHKAVPVFCGSAQLCSGIMAFLDILNVIAPSPKGLHDWTYDAKHNEVEQEITTEGPVSLFSFKTSLDQFAGKLSFVKVITGTLKADLDLINVRENKREKCGKIYMSQGKKLEETADLMAGDIGIVAKMATAHTNDSFSDPAKPVEYRPLVLPQPVFHVAISAASKKDDDKMSDFIWRVMEEDKTIKLVYNAETRENVLSGMGEMHLNLIYERFKKATKIDVQTKVPKVAYRETITGQAEAEYTHKKQSGGHGQYARVNLKIKPMERGGNFRFVNDIHGGSISKNYLPGVEKGVTDAMLEGALAGFPVVDLEATVFDGKEHPVDSSDMAFQLAARGALKECLGKAKPALLEPIMTLRVFVDEKYLGDILSDVSGKRGRVLAQNQLGGGIVEVDAEAPQSELLRYAIDLRSMTSGTGSFEVEFNRYAPLGGKQAEDVIKTAQAAMKETAAAH